MSLNMLSHIVSDIFTVFNKHLAISHKVIVLKPGNKFTLQHFNYFKRSNSLITALKMGLKTHMDNMHSIQWDKTLNKAQTTKTFKQNKQNDHEHLQHREAW